MKTLIKTFDLKLTLSDIMQSNNGGGIYNFSIVMAISIIIYNFDKEEKENEGSYFK